jgi:regulator of protease activity HflC (stomatin/prohibitin superfamily)
MHHPSFRLLVAAAALVCAGATSAQGLTRAEVQAELAAWRAGGMLDRPGEAGATEAVLAARERANETERLVAEARAAQELAAANDQRRLASYVEQGADGEPQVVLLSFDSEGRLESAETLALASID